MYYRNYWQPQPEEKLVCSHEKNNPHYLYILKIYETYVDTHYYQREETHIVGSFIDGTAKLRKMIKTVVKKHNQINVTIRKLMLFHQETLELFFKNVAQYQVQKQVLPKTWRS